MEQWTQYEGQVVDGRFPLQRYLGGSARSGVFLTEYESSRAVIKFVPSDPPGIARRIADWEAAAQLSHPHLLRIFAGGEYRLGEIACAYVVTEYAGESLAIIPADQPLTPQEARDMLGPVLGALEYLHDKGLVHGDLKPSNVMAQDDAVKLSGDTVSRAGEASPADDLLALGRVLKQCIPALPAPFDEIVRHCLDPDPQARWTAARIARRLGKPGDPTRRPGLAWREIAAVGVILLAGAVWLSRSRGTDVVSTPAAAAPKVAASNPPAKAPASPKARVTAEGVLTKVLPEIPTAARDTIRGTVRVNVRVSVDPAGAVTDASLEPPPASKYLSRFVLEAARRWRFQPSDGDQEWVLRFDLLRDDTRVSARRSNP